MFPALIEAVIGKRFAQGGKAGFETINVLDPEFRPVAQASAGIDEAAEVDHGIRQVTEQNEVPGCRIRVWRASTQRAQRRRVQIPVREWLNNLRDPL